MTGPTLSGYTTLEQAVDDIGRRLMPREWLGQETKLLEVDSHVSEELQAAGEGTDTPLGRLRRAVNYLLRALSAGKLKAIIADGRGHYHDFQAALWERPDIRTVFRPGELADAFRVAAEGHRADAGKRWMLVSKLDIDQILLELPAGPEATNIEGEFRAWLGAKLGERAGGKIVSKKQTWMEAQRAFGWRMPYHAFERIWTATVPEAWRRPARAGQSKPA